MPTIKVEIRRPIDLPNGGRFKFKSNIDLEDNASAEGSYAECYAFHKTVGEIKAILFALQQINCIAEIHVHIDHDQNLETGYIYAWDAEAKLIAEEAVASISDLVRRTNRMHGKCSVGLLCKIDRVLT